GRTCEFIVENGGVRLVDDAQTSLPQADAVIGLIVIGGLELLVKSSELLPDAARRQQKCSGTIVDVPAKHVHGGEWIVAPAITETTSVAPDNASRLLKHAIEQNDPRPDRADIDAAFQRSDRRGQ